MTEWVPVALACGHVLVGQGYYQVPGVEEAAAGETALVECPEGCGWQRYVVEPHDGEQRCLCHTGRHICGLPNQTVIVDLGERDEGDEIRIEYLL